MSVKKICRTDIHVHSASARYLLAFGDPRHPETHYVAEPEELKTALLEKGITRAVLMSSGEHEEQGLNTLGAYNSDCEKIASMDPSFYAWMCNLNPAEERPVYDRLLEYRQKGAVGIGELMINRPLDDAFLEEVFEAAQELDLPVTFHMSPQQGYSYGVCDGPGLPLLEKALQKYPKLKFLGHSQVFWMEISADAPADPAGRNGFGRGPVVPGGRLEELFDSYPNLYGDLSAFSAYCAVTRDEAYGISFLNKYADRLLFATDATNKYNIPPLADYLDACLASGVIPQAAYEKICYQNAKELYGI